MSLVDRGILTLSSREEDSISLNDRRETEFHFLQSLLRPFVEGVWVSEGLCMLKIASLWSITTKIVRKDYQLHSV